MRPRSCQWRPGWRWTSWTACAGCGSGPGSRPTAPTGCLESWRTCTRLQRTLSSGKPPWGPIPPRSGSRQTSWHRRESRQVVNVFLRATAAATLLSSGALSVDADSLIVRLLAGLFSRAAQRCGTRCPSDSLPTNFLALSLCRGFAAPVRHAQTSSVPKGEQTEMCMTTTWIAATS